MANVKLKSQMLCADVRKTAIGWESTVLAMTVIPVRDMVNVKPTRLANATTGIHPVRNIGTVRTVINAKTTGMAPSVKCTVIPTKSMYRIAKRKERGEKRQTGNK